MEITPHTANLGANSAPKTAFVAPASAPVAPPAAPVAPPAAPVAPAAPPAAPAAPPAPPPAPQEQDGVNGNTALPAAAPATDAKAPQPSTNSLLPSLRGTLKTTDDGTLWEGVWGMDDNSFDAGITSPFSYKMTSTIEPGEGAAALPAGISSGVFSGHFLMKDLSNKSAETQNLIKISERTVELVFTSTDGASVLAVSGHGSNKFGYFKLHGSLDVASMNLTVYKEYCKKPKLARRGTSRKVAKKKPSPRHSRPKRTASSKTSHLPCLRGLVRPSDDGTFVWEGHWGMSIKDFNGGYISEFKYERVDVMPVVGTQDGDPLPDAAKSGYYTGYFMMGSTDGGPPTKHQETSVEIRISRDPASETMLKVSRCFFSLFCARAVSDSEVASAVA